MKWLTGVRPKELGVLYRSLDSEGVRVELTRRNHVRMTFPDGSVEYGPLTSSDQNVHKKVRQSLRRRGRLATLRKEV